ncbi:MAG: glycosyltransferase family 39 protein [Candidatus Daviesbacteria bacterium]|nr:glycosyltransferase family 39 protein [Candidatus Daviesbacteria bacterium]
MNKGIIVFIILAFILRIFFIFDGGLSFHYDMARDAYQALAIWQGDLKIQGPPTTTDGLFSGVGYYYLLSIPYGLSGGDPRVAAIFLSLISSLSIIPIFLLTKDLFKSITWAYLAAFLFAISFEATQYGPWLSNPSPVIFTAAWFFYFLRRWQKGERWGLPLTSVFASLSVQMELFTLFLFFAIIAFKFIFNIKVSLQQLFTSILISSLILITFIISAIKFNTINQIFNGFSNISQSADINFRIKFSDLLLNYIDRFANLFTNNFFPSNIFLGGILGLIVLIILIKFISQKKSINNIYGFILFCLLSNFPIFLFGGQNATYTMVGIVTPAILGVCILLQNFLRINRSLTFGLILIMILSNLYMIFKIAPQGEIILVIPQDMNLKNQLSLIDETYRQSIGQPFSINTLTLPLWTNTTWAYLYSWYGQKNYGYVPSFYGRDPVGQLGENSLPKTQKPLAESFFIIEPPEGIPSRFFVEEIQTEDSKTELITETNYNSLKLQKRAPLHE